jgi:cytoskeletal protein CcmA (bactofilin family)
VEVVLSMPAFPFAIACSGPFFSDGQLHLTGVSSPQAFVLGQVSPDQERPANLLSNGRGARAVQLGPNTSISGDLRSAGQVSLDPTGSRVGGEIIQNAPLRSIPQVNLSELDPQVQGRSPVLQLSEASVIRPGYQGFVRRQGDLQVQGGLVLDNGVLFVDGNLQVRGGIRGLGAVIATGSLDVEGNCQWSSDDRLALVSGGPLKLSSGGFGTSFFQGMIYSAGRFEADHMTLLGALIVQAGRSECVLRQSNLIHAPGLSELTVRPGSGLPLDFSGGGSGSQQLTVNVVHQPDGYAVQNPDDDSVEFGLNEGQALARLEEILQSHQLGQDYTPQELLTRLQALPPSSLDTGSKAPVYTLNPSLFLKIEDRLRLVFWREF